eukprot:Pgem_evm1s14615
MKSYFNCFFKLINENFRPIEFDGEDTSEKIENTRNNNQNPTDSENEGDGDEEVDDLDGFVNPNRRFHNEEESDSEMIIIIIWK